MSSYFVFFIFSSCRAIQLKSCVGFVLVFLLLSCLVLFSECEPGSVRSALLYFRQAAAAWAVKETRSENKASIFFCRRWRQGWKSSQILKTKWNFCLFACFKEAGGQFTKKEKTENQKRSLDGVIFRSAGVFLSRIKIAWVLLFYYLFL